MAPRIQFLVPLGIWALTLLAGCAATDEGDDPWPTESGSRESAIGWIGGEAVTYGDLARFLRTRDALTFSRTLDSLLVERITRMEADRGLVTVPVAQVERRTRNRYAAFTQRLRESTAEQTGKPVEPRVWLERTIGLTPERFQLFLRSQIEVELLQDRLIRYAEFRGGSAEVSLIVVEDGELAQSMRARLARGELFADLARALSLHATAKGGGLVDHRMIAADFDDEEDARQVFAAKPGAVIGPLARTADGRRFYRLYLVDALHAPQDEPFAELSSAIEADLEKRPVSVGEYVHWRRRMQERHAFLASASGVPVNGVPVNGASGR